jgi:hypothetical protein
MRAKREASELIFTLWQHRAELAGRANPMKEYEGAVKQLNAMNSDGFFVYGSPRAHDVPLEEYRRSSNRLFTSLFLLEVPTDLDEEDAAVKSLSKTEQKLLRELSARKSMRFIIRFTSSEKVDPKEARKKEIRAEIERVRTALNILESGIDELVERSISDDEPGITEALDV